MKTKLRNRILIALPLFALLLTAGAAKADNATDAPIPKLKAAETNKVATTAPKTVKATTNPWVEPDPILIGTLSEAPAPRQPGDQHEFSTQDLERLELLRTVTREARGPGDAAKDHASFLQELNRQLAEARQLIQKEHPGTTIKAPKLGASSELEEVEQTLGRMQERLRKLRDGMTKTPATAE